MQKVSLIELLRNRASYYSECSHRTKDRTEAALSRFSKGSVVKKPCKRRRTISVFCLAEALPSDVRLPESEVAGRADGSRLAEGNK